MNCKQINQIDIAIIMEKLGHKLKKSGEGFLANVPYRKDKHPSFYFVHNRWKDLATGEYGRTVDLIQRIFECDVPTAIQNASELLGSDSKHHQMNKQLVQTESLSTTKLIKVFDRIEHRALKAYVLSRCIPLQLANNYCKEIHYIHNNITYYTIGFVNDVDGYATSNRLSKRALGKQCISTIGGSQTVFVTEGFFDFLSAIVLQPVYTSFTSIVLNSTANIKQCLTRLTELNPSRIIVGLDNDDAGRAAANLIKSCHRNAYDISDKYANHKDLYIILFQVAIVLQIINSLLQMTEYLLRIFIHIIQPDELKHLRKSISKLGL